MDWMSNMHQQLSRKMNVVRFVQVQAGHVKSNSRSNISPKFFHAHRKMNDVKVLHTWLNGQPLEGVHTDAAGSISADLKVLKHVP